MFLVINFYKSSSSLFPFLHLNLIGGSPKIFDIYLSIELSLNWSKGSGDSIVIKLFLFSFYLFSSINDCNLFSSIYLIDCNLSNSSFACFIFYYLKYSLSRSASSIVFCNANFSYFSLSIRSYSYFSSYFCKIKYYISSNDLLYNFLVIIFVILFKCSSFCFNSLFASPSYLSW